MEALGNISQRALCILGTRANTTTAQRTNYRYRGARTYGMSIAVRPAPKALFPHFGVGPSLDVNLAIQFLDGAGETKLESALDSQSREHELVQKDAPV